MGSILKADCRSGSPIPALWFLAAMMFVTEPLPAQTPLAPPGSAARFSQLKSLPHAAQCGPSCGFFANIPAVSMATGINIVDGSPESKRFIAAVYGLRRGDFRFERSFDKAVFLALFGLSSEESTIYQPGENRKQLLPATELLLDTALGDALDAGQAVSIRVIGAFGGNHNILLLARDGDRFLYHDPFPGIIRSASKKELAGRILNRSTLAKNQTKHVYFNSYRIVSVGRPGWQRPRAYSKLPDTLNPSLDDETVRHLAAAFGPSPPPAPASPAALSAAYPGLRFAFTRHEEKDGTVLKHTIDQSLTSAKLVGLVLLARFHLNAVQLNTRRSLPVLFLGGRPHAFVACRVATQDDPTTVTLHDGHQTIRLSDAELLGRLSPLLAFYDPPGPASTR